MHKKLLAMAVSFHFLAPLSLANTAASSFTGDNHFTDTHSTLDATTENIASIGPIFRGRDADATQPIQEPALSVFLGSTSAQLAAFAALVVFAGVIFFGAGGFLRDRTQRNPPA